jgi:rare lipoprotein A
MKTAPASTVSWARFFEYLFQRSEGGTARVPEARTERRPAKRTTEKPLATQTGLASYYGAADNEEMFAAHPSYARGTLVRVTNIENGRKVNVRVRDRGPTAEEQAKGLIIDVSRAAAEELGFIREGKVRVRVEVLEWGKGRSK